MPNRIIKESITTSETIDQLKPDEECFFYRLMVNCDDYGRMDARPSILLAKCFPLKIETMKAKDIQKMINILVKHKLIFIYCEGKYLQMATWDKHQQIRAKRSKYPCPTDDDINGYQLISDDCICHRNPIQSESNPNLNPIPFQDVIDFLNLTAGTKFKTVDKTKTFISARWNEGYSLEDFKTVIKKKHSEWVDTPQAKYIRPETLFGTKFDGYLNQIITSQKPVEPKTVADTAREAAERYALRHGIKTSEPSTNYISIE